MLAIAISDFSTTEEDIVSSSQEEFHTPPSARSAEEAPVSSSTLSELEDQNRVISSLRNQLQNQKDQLMYYINKESTRSKIVELSESCTLQASEESLPVNLALYRFCKQSGMKTKLQLLHDRMNQLDSDVSHSLKDHEFVLRKIINRLCEFVQEMSNGDFKDQFGRFINDPLHVNLFDKLLSATLSLRSKLEMFRNCCDRILIIEEKRNAIVDRVYSLPVEDRVNCNYLVGIQMEKVQLENEIRRISRHNDAKAPDRHRIRELNVIEKILHNLQWELNSSFLENEDCVDKMLKKINSEARVLLEMTKKQKQRFECESSKAKYPELNRVLLFINLASSEDKDLDRYGIKTYEEIQFFQKIKKEIETIKKIMKEESERNFRKAKKECEVLNSKVTEVLLDNSRTKLINKSLQAELNELKTEQTILINILTQERDAYKTQVEDLHATREAYAQLVDRQPNIIEMEREFFKEVGDRDARIMELEKIVSSQKEELNQLKSKLTEESVQSKSIDLSHPHTADSPDTKKLESEKPASNFPNNKVTSLSDNCCPNEPKKEKKLVKSEPFFPHYQCPKKTSYSELARKSTSSKKSLSNSLEISSEKELWTINRQSSDTVPEASSENISPMPSEEIKYKNEHTLYEMDEFEIYEDASIECLMLE
ncbi:unnamed protein product [Ceutorhynchus assimilis]|uniref:Uncharacterized protein n=1 Tax=Ceutorhynchus assimilis TaxID=467358 RepID=A0A9N9QFG8_9CUCU|nr:unnamed protein product [Ceutorhynchus assimilis]